MRSRWGAIANPHAKVFDPKHPKFHPWGMLPATEWKLCSICFPSLICENTHKVWYKNLWNWHGHRNLIFDLLTSPQGHQLDNRMKFLHAFYCARHPVKLICHITMFEKYPLGTPAAQSPNPGAWPRWQKENPVWMCFASFISENTHTEYEIKSFELTL